MTPKEKKIVIQNLTEVPKTQKKIFWGREMKSLNELQNLYPEDAFWFGLSFSYKLDTMIILRSGYYAKELRKKYNRFKYKIPPSPSLPLGEKSGPDHIPNNIPRTLKDFLS